MNPKSELVCDWSVNGIVCEDSLTNGTCMDWSVEKKYKNTTKPEGLSYL